MGDLKSTTAIVIKGFLFLSIAMLSATLVVLFDDWRAELATLVVCIWASCRFYYFLFYVLEHYVGLPGPYAGIWDLVRRLVRRRP